MYGLLCINTNCLNPLDRNIAKNHICGLCNFLSSRYNFGFRSLTNHYAAFLSILYSAQSKGSLENTECPFRFLQSKPIKNIGLEYASAISMLMAKIKIDDDLFDNNNLSSRILSKVIDTKFPIAVNDLKRSEFNVGSILSEVNRQKNLEEQGCSDIEKLAEPTENSSSEIFVHTATLSNMKENSKPLSLMGRNIGKLMYYLDSYVDLPTDITKGRFNVLKTYYNQGEEKIREAIKQIASKSINEMSVSVKNLKLYKYENIVNQALQSSLKQQINARLSYRELNSFLPSFYPTPISAPRYPGSVKCHCLC